jgi:predicted dehydrogenase
VPEEAIMRKANRKLTRRELLKRSAAGVVLAVPWFVPAAALGRAGKPAASERITLGVIGIGPRGTYDLKAMLTQRDVQCVAVCDVQASRREAAKKLVDEHYQTKDCATYRDFHELLARSDVDAVLIATGDRWHAPASILAARAGKDVYSEKPCGLTVAWCQALDDAIRSTKRVFQAGTQRRNVSNFQVAVRLAHSGKLGKLHTLYASVYMPEVLTAWLPSEPTPPRDVVDWERWLGPAPWRPYNKQYVQGKWRGYWDFDSGARLLDWGAHTVDLCQWANNADDTMPVEYEPSPTNVTARYANGVKLVLDFLKTPFKERPGWVQSLGTCPARWARRRHRDRSARWVVHRYFCQQGGRSWRFTGELQTRKGESYRVVLMKAAEVRIERHVLIRHAANPYDPAWEGYYEARLQAKMMATIAGRELLTTLYERQEGCCVLCGEGFTNTATWQVHHRHWRVYGGDDSLDNLELLHENCHRQKHSRRMGTK